MSYILTDLSPNKIITAIEDNLSSWIPVFGMLGEVKQDDPPGVNRSICDIPMALFNSIMDTQLTSENVDETIQYLISDAQQRKVPILWWVGPSTQPADLGSRLEKSGFILDDDGPGMAVELAKLNENLPFPDGLVIEAANDDDALWTWSRTIASGFGAPAERSEFVSKSWHDLMSRVDQGFAVAYTAYLDGKPVATSLLSLGGGVAGIYAVATLPEARRKGIGAQVTLRPLLDARSLDYKVGILQSSEMGLNVYRSIGFLEYCRVSSYYFRP